MIITDLSIGLTVFAFSLILSYYLVRNSIMADEEKDGKKSGRFFGAYIILIAMACVACIGSRTIAGIIHVDYAVTDSMALGLLLGPITMTVLVSGLAKLKKKPAPAK